MSCGIIYSHVKHVCGRRAVLWSRLDVKTCKSRDIWKCEPCNAEMPRDWSTKKRGRR